MAQPSPLAPLKEIEAVRITAEDIQDDENISVYEVFQDFEDAWVEFLKTRPPILQGQTAQRIQDLQTKAHAMSESKASIETELKKQLYEIKRSRKDLERQYSPLIDAENAKQDRLKKEISTKIGTIQKSMEIFEETAPWMNFIQELDRMIPHDVVVQHPKISDSTTPPVAKPSARAMILAETTSLEDLQQLAKACHVDNALLRAHLAALVKEIERHESVAPLTKEAGDFLAKHNVWKIMKQIPEDYGEEENKSENLSCNSNDV